jgi:predicted acetyltransferase
MGETNYPSVAHVGYDISPLSKEKHYTHRGNDPLSFEI